jgi:aspartyl-tRNA(Asn)/glutamyl-tRNA(Gln) amidotransferase subunit C
MAVTPQEVRHVAQLARLVVSDQGAQQLAEELSTILHHMEVLNRVNTKGVDDASVMGGAGMPLRADRGPSIPLGEPPQAFAPEMREGFFVVPRLSTHDDVDAGNKEAP